MTISSCINCGYRDVVLVFEASTDVYRCRCGLAYSGEIVRSVSAFRAVPRPSDTEDIPFTEEEEVPNLPEIPPDRWYSVPLPEGFDWYRDPTETEPGLLVTNPREIAAYPVRIAALRAWADEHDFRLGVARNMEVYAGVVYVNWPQRILVSNETEETWASQYADVPWESDFECPLCGETHLAYTVTCPTAERYLACGDCGRGMFETHSTEARNITFHTAQVPAAQVPHSQPSVVPSLVCGLICSSCGHPCDDEDCEVMVRGRYAYCDEHGQHGICGACDNDIEARADDDPPWISTETYSVVCFTCADSLCPECGYFTDHPFVYSGDLDAYVCRRCFREAMGGAGEEEFDNAATMSARALRIPTIPGRENIRLCGVEIEGGTGEGNGSDLASALYEAGLSTSSEVMGYHHGRGSGFAHVERDSSVDWEMVVGPLNPAVRDDVVRLNRAVRTVRDMVKEGTLKLDLRAGCHIHVGAERVSLDGAFNLNTIFAYIEDVMFRLGAAKWPIHRAIQGSDYARPVPKETRKLSFARAAGDESNGRYYALSFNNYFNAMLGSCNCGAVRYDSWEDCTCNLGKCTFEFRVFNTTANPRKLHAYLALTQALVAKALKLGAIEDPATDFPALTFVSKRFKDMTDAEKDNMIDEWQERLEWIFSELPLTADEKESIRYCVRNSELVNIGDDFINNLIPAAAEAQVEEVAA